MHVCTHVHAHTHTHTHTHIHTHTHTHTHLPHSDDVAMYSVVPDSPKKPPPYKGYVNQVCCQYIAIIC